MYRVQPRTESFVAPSKDGRFVIHKTIITTRWPAGYMRKVISGASLRKDSIKDALTRPGALDAVLERTLGKKTFSEM